MTQAAPGVQADWYKRRVDRMLSKSLKIEEKSYARELTVKT